MTRRHRHRLSSKKAGLPPGTLVATAPAGEPCAGISQVLYDAAGYAGREVQTIEEAFRAPGDRRVLWINVDGVHQLPVLERIGARFGLHPLLLEDIAHTEQRPKLEHYGEHLFMDLNAIRTVEGMEEIQTEQISLVLGPDWLLSFNEAPQPYVAAIRERLRTDKAHARQGGADFLAYTVLDAVVDGYYSVLEHVADRVEVLEEELMARPTPATLQAVYGLKREVIHLRKSIWPLRELINGLQRERDLVRETTGIYLRDLYDHTVQIMDTVETYRDVIAGMLDIYLSSVSNRMNEIMKVLTVIATIFIPLTFLAGVYGMNFEHFPEVRWRYGYLMFWVVNVVIAALMLRQFHRRRWL